MKAQQIVYLKQQIKNIVYNKWVITFYVHV